MSKNYIIAVVWLQMIVFFLNLIKFYIFSLIMKKEFFKSKGMPSKFSNKKSGWSNTIWIVLISLIFFLFLVFSKWNKIEEFFGFSTNQIETTDGFQIGEEISVEWIISQDGDFVTHTHKLSTLSSGVFGLKSKSINLNQYSGTVLLEWTIDSTYQGLYILNVSKILDQIDEEIDDETESWTIVWQYISEAGLYFVPEFFENYEISAVEKDNIKIKSFAKDQEIVVNFFACKKWDLNLDCDKLENTYKNSGEKSFATQYATNYYKLSEVSSWFFANEKLIGYQIHDILEQDVIDLSSYMIVPNKEYLKNTLETKIWSICKKWNISMDELEKTSLSLENSKLIFNVLWKREEWNAECAIEIDPSLSSFWILKNFDYQTEESSDIEQEDKQEAPKEDTEKKESEDKKEETVKLPEPKPSKGASDVAQYPLNLEKPLVFKSSRWHSISFPSPRISYKSDSVSENLDTAGINCYVATKVIEYDKKDLIDSEPTVIIYECNIKDAVEIPYQYYTYPVSDGRVFVASVRNPAWHDFANNLQVELND